MLLFWGVTTNAQQQWEVINLEPAGKTIQVGEYEKLELGVSLPAAIQNQVARFIRDKKGLNPYNPEDIDLRADFISPSGKRRTVFGFFYEDYQRGRGKEWEYKNTDHPWRIRHALNEVGVWKIQVKCAVRDHGELDVLKLRAECKASDNPGFITTGNEGNATDRYLRFSKTGKTFFAIGENMDWADHNFTAKSFLSYQEWMTELSQNGGNFTRIGLVPWGMMVEWDELGNYHPHQTDLWEMDQLFELAKELGIYINLHMNIHDAFRPPAWKSSTYAWFNNPYNKEIEGVNEPIDFFQNQEAIKYYKHQLRYQMARWGYATNLALWELLSEVDGAIEAYNHGHEETKIINAWLKEMRRYIREDLGDDVRPVSASVAKGEERKIPQKMNPFCDISFSHDYGRDEDQNYNQRWKRTRKLLYNHSTRNKPVIHQEVGGGFPIMDSATDLTFHNAIWATSLSGNLGCGMNWWWDNAIHPAGYEVNFKPLSIFFEGADMAEVQYLATRWRSKEVENFTLSHRYGRKSAMGWVHNRSFWWANLYDTNPIIKDLIDANNGHKHDPADNSAYANWKSEGRTKDLKQTKVVVKRLKSSWIFWRKRYTLTFYNTRGDGEELTSWSRTVKSNLFGRVKFKVDLDETHPDVAYKLELQ